MSWGVSRRAVLAATLLGALVRTRPAAGCTADDGGMPADAVLLRDHGADPTGRRSASAAFAAALQAGRRVAGSPGDVYLLDTVVDVPAGRELVGGGATLLLARDATGLRLAYDDCTVRDWTIRGGDGRYAVLNTGRRNAFRDNRCGGNIGHFFFSTDAFDVTASGNTVDGMTADREITTAIVLENCRGAVVSGNRFRQIPVGWGVQVRKNSTDFQIRDNEFVQTRWTARATAVAGQRVFRFMLGSRCLLKKVQRGGRPLSVGYRITGQGPSYVVAFDEGQAAGATITLVGYRGAENIQIATGANGGVIARNTIDGTGDSGIICFGPHLQVLNNTVRNCGYAGIAIYGGQDHIVVKDNVIADCAQLDDGLSSPDNPREASVFAGAILVSGEDATITGNTITNAAGTMRYGVRVNKADMALRTDGSAAITIAGNHYRGEFADGHVFAPNGTMGHRINSIAVDGTVVPYPGAIDLDAAWVNAPPVRGAVATSGFGRTWAVRDSAGRRAGAASLRTIAGEYVDFVLTRAALLRDCNVEVSFWARAARGRSYLSIFTTLAGLPLPMTAAITDPAWRRYVIRFPLTARLDDVIRIRCGATSGSANIADLTITGRRL